MNCKINRALPASLLIGLLSGLLSLATVAAPLPRHEAVPGGVAVLALDLHSSDTPKVEFNDRRVMVLRDKQTWFAVVGIPLSSKPGPHQLRITPVGGKAFEMSFQVGDKEYATQRLTITKKRLVDPNAEDLKRIRRETALMQAAYAEWRPQLDMRDLFALPVDGPFSSPFGLRRFFNDKPRRPHSGLDIAASEGTPISAPAAGKVVVTGNFFFNGNTVLIDHGQGLVSMYCHMSRIDVEDGNGVARGQILGAVGKTGRVTGAHLHWSLSLNNTRVDPLLFVNAQAIANVVGAAKP